ncbi:hypothetical protein QQS21_012083 [Conoideocrella luteorostrata]|uniref:L-dopachrome isomerase n=1 Tax=Conoideocrella luteorostrata TaxID=1105319 RepID=A0AAJ0CCX5_9HYPO|nr:hypothetical protein QQS21_012083 [Conoideocrella luteorostrata]
MTDTSPLTSQRSAPSAEAIYLANHIVNDASRRTPSPQPFFSDRRSSQHLRRSNLEPVIEGEIRHTDNRRHTLSLARDATETLPGSNLAKLRVPSSTVPPPPVSSSYRRDAIIRNESALLVEVKTNVVITNEYLFMNELSYHLSLRYGRPLSSIVVSLQHGMCLLFGGFFDPAYILTVTGLPDQVTPGINKRNVAILQSHLHQAIRVPPSRGLVRFVPIAEGCLNYGGEKLASAMAGPAPLQPFQTGDPQPLRRPASTAAMATNNTGNIQHMVSTKPPPRTTQQKVRDENPGPSDTKTMKKKKSFIPSMFTRSHKDTATT